MTCSYMWSAGKKEKLNDAGCYFFDLWIIAYQ